MTDEDFEGVWVRTEPALDGQSFIVTMQVSADHSIHLTEDLARAHAMEVLTAVERACMDAAIFKQLANRVSKEDAAQAILDLRGDRPDQGEWISAPMSLRPGVNPAGKPFLYVLMDGEPVGQWEIEDAREHATGVLGAFITADLDMAYLRYLRGVIGLDEEPARGIIADLVRYR